MALGAVRMSQDSAGGILIQGSPDVMTNGTPQVRLGDRVQPHGPGLHGGPVMAEGSSTVFVNNIPACHETHKANCGHPATGSPNVFIGG